MLHEGTWISTLPGTLLEKSRSLQAVKGLKNSWKFTQHFLKTELARADPDTDTDADATIH